MQLTDALERISEIHGQLARNETFRGYRAATVGFTGIVAIAAGTIQAIALPDPRARPEAWLGLWIAAAAIGLIATGVELIVECRRAASRRVDRITRNAVEQFLPCVVAGGVVTTALFRSSPDHLWLFPGLWATLFGLGVFASLRLLPRSIIWAGLFYLIAGGVLLACGPNGPSLAPWGMAVTFGVGQFLTATILHFRLERERESS